MQIEFLGTGGAFTTPRPGCLCRVCIEAREKGIPYSRSGPSLFLHGPDILIDTPEESKDQLNRSQVKTIRACFYSHWHPDHVMGRRVWETLNWDTRHWPPRHRQTDIYLPQQVAIDFRRRLGNWEHFSYMAEQGWIQIIELTDGESVVIDKTHVQPFRVAENYVYAFLCTEGEKRILIAPDELKGWDPPAEMRSLDLAVIPMGVVEFDPFTGERRIPEKHPILKIEATYRQTLDIVRKLDAQRVIMTHIEEPDGMSFDDLQKLEKQLQAEGLPITFAYDTMLIAL